MNKSNRIARALSKVSTEPTPKGCLLWEGPVDKDGYGRVRLSKKNVFTHRLVWAFGLEGQRHGAMPPPEVVIRHRCDVPRCVNPEHLQAGSVADNNRDRDERGRHRSARGDANGARKHPERVPRGDAHYSRQRPELMARGDAHWSRKHPERVPRGDAHGARKHPERRPRGEAHGNATLSDAAVEKIHELRAEGLLLREIAVLVGCSQPNISLILRGIRRSPLAAKRA